MTLGQALVLAAAGLVAGTASADPRRRGRRRRPLLTTPGELLAAILPPLIAISCLVMLVRRMPAPHLRVEIAVVGLAVAVRLAP